MQSFLLTPTSSRLKCSSLPDLRVGYQNVCGVILFFFLSLSVEANVRASSDEADQWIKRELTRKKLVKFEKENKVW